MLTAIALYARKSIERENSISCETQLEYCMAMIKPDEKNEQILTFIDNGFSGGNVNRDGFQKMMRKIKEGKISKVLVYRLDRISRSLSDFVNILSTFKEHGVEFVSTQEAFDTGSPYGELIVKILAVFAEFERQSIIQRVTQAYEHRSQMGFYMGGRKPYGFDLEPTVINNVSTKRLKPICREIEQIRYIFETYSAPSVTLGGLLENLTGNSINPHSGGGWTTAKLSAILKNPIYVCADNKIYEYFQGLGIQIISPPEAFDGIHGIQIYGKTKHKPQNSDNSDIKAVVMTHEGVIASDIWIKCQKKLSENRQIRNAVSNKTSWLGGKIICARCARTMTTIKAKNANGGIRRYFICTGKTHFKNCKGTECTLYADSLEEMAYKEIEKKLEALKNVKTDTHKSLPPEINILRNKLKAIELSQNKIADMMTMSESSTDLLDIMSKRATELKAQKADILLRIDAIEHTDLCKKQTVNLSKKWKTATFEQKRGVCYILINRIIIDKNGNAEIVWNI